MSWWRRALALLALLPALAGAGVLLIGKGKTSVAVPTPPSQAVGSIDIDEGGLSSDTDPAMRVSRLNQNAIDVGDGEFTLEMFVRLAAEPGGNNDANTSTGACYVNCATNGNLLADGDNYNGSGSGASWIVGFDQGVLYLGVRNAGGDRTVPGTSDNRTGSWRHIAVQFRASDGLIEIFANGAEEAEFDGPNGTVAFNSSSTADQDEFIYFGMEKLAAGGYGIDGEISEVRLSTVRRYTGTTYTVPTAPWTADGDTVWLAHLDESSGTTVTDYSASAINGELVGTPNPTRSTADPF